MPTTTKTKPAINLFATGTKVKEPAKKPGKPVFISEVLTDQCKQFLELKNRIEADTASFKMVEGDIKAEGKKLLIAEYQKIKMKPENFKIQDATGAACLFIVMDKYTTVDETKAEILGQYDGILDEKTVYTINPEMVDKYGQVLSTLIMNCKEIAAEDKAAIISGELTYSVAKGSIERLMQYEQPAEIFELINPICALKK